MIKIPKSLSIANLPTKIEKLDRLTKELDGPNIYIKRDDQTGSEVSGNKVRKLEFVVKEAIDKGCNMLITCGGLQSNHARATAAIAAKLGISSYLVLRSYGEEILDGNYFIDKLLGARFKFITPKQYSKERMTIMETLKEEVAKEGYKAYIIPEGASSGIGTFGYFKAIEEIMVQEKEMGINFDAVVLAVGSGGTYGGLVLGKRILGYNGEVYGFNVCDDEEYFVNNIYRVLQESHKYIEEPMTIKREDIKIIDGYVGKGYAQSSPEELDFIHHLAKLEGVILDPVYTGKAMYGLTQEVKKGRFKDYKNILFIHTGGLFGLFPQKELFFK